MILDTWLEDETFIAFCYNRRLSIIRFLRKREPEEEKQLCWKFVVNVGWLCAMIFVNFYGFIFLYFSMAIIQKLFHHYPLFYLSHMRQRTCRKYWWNKLWTDFSLFLQQTVFCETCKYSDFLSILLWFLSVFFNFIFLYVLDKTLKVFHNSVQKIE